MLYRTVYGLELEAIYQFVSECAGTQGIHKGEVYEMFLVSSSDGKRSTQSIDDALHFLIAAHLLEVAGDHYHPKVIGAPSQGFRLLLLRQLRLLQLNQIQAVHPADPTYLMLLEEIFIRSRRQFVTKVHIAANQVADVKALGGLNREKIQAWARIMAFLGLGYRVKGGFLFAPKPDLLLEIFCLSNLQSGILQDLFEHHLTRYLPCLDGKRDLSLAFETALLYLQQTGAVHLYTLQDSPSRPYFGNARYRGFSLIEQY